MARNFARASTQYTYVPTSGTYTTNLSFALRVRFASIPGSSATYFVLSLGNVGGSGVRLNLYLGYRDVSGARRWLLGYTNGDASYNEFTHNVELTTNQWYSVSGHVDWAPNPDTQSLYMDGSSLALTGSSTNVTPDGGAYRWTVGAFGYSAGTSQSHDGDLAEVALWNAVLNAGEHAAYAAGDPPPRIRPASLISYIPLLGGVDCRVIGAGTNVGTTSTDHPPRVLYPRARRPFYPAAAAPPAAAGGSSGYIPFQGPFGHPFNIRL